LAAARIPAASDVKRSSRASLLSAATREKESDSPAHAANGAGGEDANSRPAHGACERTPMHRARMPLPVAGLTAPVVAGGAYWWVHTRQTAITQDATHAPVVAKAPPAPAPHGPPSAALAAVAPHVPARTARSAQQRGFAATTHGAKQRVQGGATHGARPREEAAAPRRPGNVQPTRGAQGHAPAAARTHQRQDEGSVQLAKSQQTAPQVSQPAQGLQGRVDALREGISSCQSKGNFLTREHMLAHSPSSPGPTRSVA
jgi:hypothetical protein